MELIHWITAHTFEILEGIGIIGSLLFTAISFRREDRSRHIANLLAITAQHRDIWSEVLDRPELARVLEKDVDILASPVTNAEALFVTFLIFHLHASFRAARSGLFTTFEGLAKDVEWFFSLPIPRAVWERSAAMLDAEFRGFVEAAMVGE